MKNKESGFIMVILIILVIGLSFLHIGNTKEINRLAKDNKQLQDTMTALKSALETEEKLRGYALKGKFEMDCRYRNYSYYDNERSFCCKWVNDNRICMDWLTVVSETLITINPHNFLSQNATILIESDLGFDDEFTISLKRPTKYDECRVYDYFDEIKIVCNDYY